MTPCAPPPPPPPAAKTRSRLDILKNTKYTEKMFVRLISLSQKGYFILYNEDKIAFCFKKGCFIALQKQRFRLKNGCFPRPESAKRVYFSSLGTSVVYILVGSRGAGKPAETCDSDVPISEPGFLAMIWMSYPGDRASIH